MQVAGNTLAFRLLCGHHTSEELGAHSLPLPGFFQAGGLQLSDFTIRFRLESTQKSYDK